MPRKKDRFWKETFTMLPPFAEGMIKVWAESAEKAIAYAKSTQNLNEITSVTIVGTE